VGKKSGGTVAPAVIVHDAVRPEREKASQSVPVSIVDGLKVWRVGVRDGLAVATGMAAGFFVDIIRGMRPINAIFRANALRYESLNSVREENISTDVNSNPARQPARFTSNDADGVAFGVLDFPLPEPCRIVSCLSKYRVSNTVNSRPEWSAWE